MSVAALSLVTQMYQKKSVRAISMLEMSYGLGMVLGPLLGTLLFWIGGY